MANPQDRMGFERRLYYGTAGSTAGTLLTNVLDINCPNAITYGSTKVRGLSTSVPIDSEKAVSRKPTVTWGMHDQPNDAQLALLRAAGRAAGVVALKVTEFNSASVETTILDGDFNVKCDDAHPLAGEATFSFEATPSRDYGRDVAFS